MKKLILIALLFCMKLTQAQIISTVCGNGNQAYSGDGAQATAAELWNPSGVVFDAAGNMYIADESNMRIRKVTPAGIITTFAGNGTHGYSGDGGQATSAGLSAPGDIIFDVAGNLYIADYANNVIRRVNTNGIINTFAGNGYGAGVGSGGYIGDGGQATNAELFYPYGLALDDTGNLYIADGANSVIRKVNTLGIISTIAGNGTQGYGGDGGQSSNAKLNNPKGITVDAIGNLYIADYGNNVVRRVNTNGIISTFAGNGTAGYSGDGGQATGAEMNPLGLTVDVSGNLYISDANNNRIRMVINVGQAGIEQVTGINGQVNVYPNPSNGSFVIEANNTKQTMQVYDVNGKLVLSQTINGKTTVDASSLNEGVYNISLISNEGVVNKRLVIVR
ncbi:MAG TPA: T9SS type A sorting domain-containing protein [Bacteroidia bacterium]